MFINTQHEKWTRPLMCLFGPEPFVIEIVGWQNNVIGCNSRCIQFGCSSRWFSCLLLVFVRWCQVNWVYNMYMYIINKDVVPWEVRLCTVVRWCISILINIWSRCCSLCGLLLYRLAVVFLDRRHPCLRSTFDSTIPVDIVWMESYVYNLFNLTSIPMRVSVH